MSGEALLFLCAAVMITLMLIRRKMYGVTALKSLLITLPVSVLGFLSTYVMYYLENLEFGGQSFYGAVLFFPICLLPLSWIFHMPLSKMLDYATPAGLALLVPFRLNCYLGGCCGGKVIWYSLDGIPTHFPSQLVEMFTAMIITGILLYFERKKAGKGFMYPLCLIIYGSTRLILNQFRSDSRIYLLNMTAGTFWSSISILLGIIGLIVIIQKNNRRDA